MCLNDWPCIPHYSLLKVLSAVFIKLRFSIFPFSFSKCVHHGYFKLVIRAVSQAVV